ncbi:MAG: HYR domain-containing protein [bacterium]
MRTIFTLLFCLIFTGAISANQALKISTDQYGYHGDTVQVRITLENFDPGLELGGFDLLIDYGQFLTLNSVEPGYLISDCDWEYFGYSEAFSHSVRLIAIADINNGPVHPSCYLDSVGLIATAKFIINDTSTGDDRFLPIRWKWYDCGDNGISSRDGFTLHISDEVYGFDGYTYEIITADTAFPTFYGAPSSCTVSPSENLLRTFDFYNGGVNSHYIDTIPPIAICPHDTLIFNAPGECGRNMTFSAYAFDNLGGAWIESTPPSGSYFHVGINNITCIAYDSSGNSDTCGFKISVYDHENPSIVCPENITTYVDPGLCGAVVNYDISAQDNCIGLILTGNPPSGSFFPPGSTTVLCQAVDGFGNDASCSFKVYVNDTIPPAITCPENIIVPNDPGQCGAVVEFEADIYDNCEVWMNSWPASGSFFNIGTTIVNYIAVDAFGNGSVCTLMVTVEDIEPPIINCISDMIVNNDQDECGAVVNFDINAMDNCASANLIITPPSGSFFDVGTTNVIAIANDDAGNSDTCNFNITVNDTETPVAVCPDDITVFNDSGLYGATVFYEPTMTDNCSGWIYSVPPSGSFFEPGISEIYSVAVDQSSNQDTCYFNVEVLLVDSDNDGYNDWIDNCPYIYNPDQLNDDADSWGNLCDNCPGVANNDQNNSDNDSLGNLCDNCPEVYNPQQEDTDLDGIGDLCCCSFRGNADNFVAGQNPIDVADITYLVSYLFKGGAIPPCPEQGNANAIGGPELLIDVSDIVYLVNYLFKGGPIPPAC